MRCVVRALAGRLAAVALAAMGLAAPAAAQGFFESLFGGGGQQAPAYVPQRPLMPGYSHRAPLFVPHRDRSEAPRDEEAHQSRSGHYRTVCVRMCDGYYFPISSGVGRSRFYRDANICRSSCGEEAKLFYQAASTPEASELVDLQGRPYSRLPTAFLYRKSLVEGCKCKPDPWSQSEIDRHRGYAAAEAAGRAGNDRVAEKASLGPSDPAVARRGKVSAGAAQPKTEAAAGVVGPSTETAGPSSENRREETSHEVPAQPTAHEAVDNTVHPSQPADIAQQGKYSDRAYRQRATDRHRDAAAGERRRATAASAPATPAPRRAAAPVAAGGGPYGLGGAKPAGRWPGD